MLNPWGKHETSNGLDKAEKTSKSAKEPGSSSSLCHVCNRWCECGTLLRTCVGVIWLMSSDASCFSKVVFPPLSRPSSSILTSWSGVLFSLRRIDSNPCNKQRDQPCDGKRYFVRGAGGALLQLATIVEMHLPHFHPLLTYRPWKCVFKMMSELSPNGADIIRQK